MSKKIIFTAIVLILILLFGYDAYVGNSSHNQDKTILSAFYVAVSYGSFFIVPLLLSLVFIYKRHTTNLPWKSLLILCVGVFFQFLLSENFLVLFVWFLNIFLACAVAYKCYLNYALTPHSSGTPNGAP